MKFIEVHASWKLAKSNDPRDQIHLRTSLAVCFEALRLVATILMPILPTASQQILAIFQINEITWEKRWSRMLFPWPIDR
jgi:methionyl-tRNA synthetase